MSWLYSQALVEGYLPQSCSDGEPSAQSSKNLTARLYCAKDRMTDFSRLSRSGMTFAPLTEGHGEALLTSYLAAFPVRTYPQQEQAKGLMESAPASGKKWRESLAKYDPDTHSLRIAQCSLFEDLTEFSATLPRWGSMQNGVVYQQPTQGQITREIESGLLPTTLATDWKGGTDAIRKDRGNVRLDQWRDYLKVMYSMTYPHPTHSEARMGFPLGWTDLKPLEMDKFHNRQ